eukprot:COSAG01_NODE_30362_length_617_cov_1.100386_1_plen_75_part_10
MHVVVARTMVSCTRHLCPGLAVVPQHPGKLTPWGKTFLAISGEECLLETRYREYIQKLVPMSSILTMLHAQTAPE